MVSEFGNQHHVVIVNQVLILVLVEDGFGGLMQTAKLVFLRCLNPCFSGRWFRRKPIDFIPNPIVVLILVLVEDGFGDISRIMEMVDNNNGS